jgi:hypothetical protein
MNLLRKADCDAEVRDRGSWTSVIGEIGRSVRTAVRWPVIVTDANRMI